jgi:alkylglycerol monooxygenase
VVTWLLAIVGVDFLYYWWHRLSHEVNVLWAAHVVHHTSEDFNLAVALRQAVVTHFTAIPFYLPLALLGVPAWVYVTVNSFNTLYQFWIHTELIGKLGPLEWVLNTPSHHRVHHAINAHYLDKNYAGSLIVWDRMFGTFIEENEEPVYGTTRPLRSYDPLWTQFHYWFELASESLHAPLSADRWRVWLASPAWHPRTADGAPVPSVSTEHLTRASRPKFDPHPSRGAVLYVLANFAIALGVTTVILFTQDQITLARLTVGTTLVVMTMVACAALCEGKRWARSFEAARLATVLATVMIAVALR